MEKKDFYTTGEVANLLDISRATVSRKFDEGVLEGKKNPITGERLISRESLISLMKQFNISFQRFEIDAASAVTGSASRSKPEESLHIILGSPDPQLHDLVKQTFEHDTRISIDMFENGYDALIKCSISPPDLFIIDDELTDISSAEAVKSLKRQSIKKSLKILCCLKTYDPVKIERIGADDYLSKDALAGAELSNKIALLGFMFGNITGDITSLQKYEDQYLKTKKPDSLDLLSNKIINDFNNILTSIYGNVTLAKLMTDETSEVYDILSDAETATRLAKDLSNQLRLFSLGGALIKSPLELAKVLDESCSFSLRRSPCHCTVQVPQDAGIMYGDEDLIKQAFNNIMTNADQSMADGGSITISADKVSSDEVDGIPEPEGEYLRITISDEGTGIPQEYLPKVFDQYFTTKPKVSGLGLTLTKSIIEKHDGGISIASEVGVGTTVTVYLPAASDTEALESPQISSGEISTASQPKGRVLVMDDEPSVRKVISRMLEHLGYDYEVSNDGDGAIHAYQQALESDAPFDVIILDMLVPHGMGGKEVLDKIRSVDPSVKVILSTGNTGDPMVSDYKSSGFDAIIPKPYEMQQLQSILLSMLQQR